MELGQVFTKSIIANFMVEMFSLHKDAVFLDPCFGEGAFLSALNKMRYSNVYGFEIDSNLYKKTIRDYPDFVLYNSDFLQASSKRKYDGIIMNPPYVRHEKINDLRKLGVDKHKLAKNDLFKTLPSTANLYMYFIIKAISLLKKNGEMVVIFPSSWLQAKNGNRFESELYKNCSVERHINISGDVFEENALVDVIILKIKKDGQNRQCNIEHIKLINNDLVSYDDSETIDVVFKMPFSSLGSVRRGLTTGCNEMFINPSLDCCVVPIISSPKQVQGYSVYDADTDSLLVLKPEDMCNDAVMNYVNKWESKIITTGSPKTLSQKIKEDRVWYLLNLFDCRGIIFSYIIRRDMKFVYNDSKNMIRDNFYIVYPNINKWVCFALLNNYYTYYQLECTGKKYGAGLLKIQKYDIERLTFPDVRMISSVDISRLRRLGKNLAETGNKEIVGRISEVISNYTDISYERIQREYKNITKNRLENV